MNFPPDIVSAPGVTVSRRGRPRLDLTPAERIERRRLQHEAYRRRKGIPPRPARLDLTPAERIERRRLQHEAYRRRRGIGPRPVRVFTKPLELTTEERLAYCDRWDQRVMAEQRQVLEDLNSGKLSFNSEVHWFVQEGGPRVDFAKMGLRRLVPSPGRNEPCRCGSGRKFKKCCG